MACFIGIDFGTSGVRAAAVDEAYQLQALSRCDYALHDPQTWQPALTEVLAGLPLAIRQQARALTVDATSSTLVFSDGQGRIVSGPLLYNDSCGAAALSQIEAVAPQGHVVAAATSSLAKLLWAVDRDRAGLTDTYLLHQADWLGFCLHGRLGFSDYHNALKLGYDVERLRYPDWFRDLSLPVHLPTVQAPGTPLGPVLPVWYDLGFPPGCTVCAGTTDSNAAFLASTGTPTPTVGTAVTSLGSTMVLKLLSDRPVNDSRYGVYSHRLEARGQPLWLVSGASNTGGAVLRQFFGDEELQALSAQIDPEVESPFSYYPLLSPGERFPVNDPQLVPRLSPRPEEPAAFLQGLLESMARIEAKGYALLQVLGAARVQQIYTTGGGATNTAWTKIRSRILGMVPQSPVCTEAAYGCALLCSFL
ncbi:MAG: FGGY-family carbohydrate kinase [Pseudanabaenaceae cyanobacterium]